MKFLRATFLAALALLAASVVPAEAGNTVLWSTTIGDVNFPMTPTTIDGMTIGATTPAPGTFTTLSETSDQLDTGTKTATATTGAATLNKSAGVITSESLSTAAGASYTLTLTDSKIAATDQVFGSVQLGTATTGAPCVTTITPGAGSVVIVVQNVAASAALNGTIKISFMDLKN